MKQGRPSKRALAAKKSRGNWATRTSSLVAGAIYGQLRVMVPDTGRRDHGMRVALVEDIKTGERKYVRAGSLVSGNTISAGSVKKARYAEYKAKEIMSRYMDLDDIDSEVINQALRIKGVDALTGEPIASFTRKEHEFWEEGTPDRWGQKPRFQILKGRLLECSVRTEYNWAPADQPVERKPLIEPNQVPEKPSLAMDNNKPLEVLNYEWAANNELLYDRVMRHYLGRFGKLPDESELDLKQYWDSIR